MLTRCPECHTVFKITAAQLEARAGLVRCGKCSLVFLANRELVPVVEERETAAAEHDDHTALNSEELVAANAKRKQRQLNVPRYDLRTFETEHEIPTITERSRPAQTPAPGLLWNTLTLLLVVLFVVQFGYFYRDDLARHPTLTTWVSGVCRILACEISTERYVGLTEITGTTIAPHPQYENALRIRAAMVNRANSDQPYPLLQVALTDRAGKLLARRTFSYRDYLEQPQAAELLMSPHVAVNTLLDVTNPDGKAVGYEILLLPP